jgi:hypothetical protein
MERARSTNVQLHRTGEKRPFTQLRYHGLGGMTRTVRYGGFSHKERRGRKEGKRTVLTGEHEIMREVRKGGELPDLLLPVLHFLMSSC